IELCNSLGIPLKEEAISVEEIEHIDEAFLTGTSTQIASIQQIDDKLLYSENEKGPITKKLQEAFLKLK
ncbi:aminotransferase class IV, partial [Maribacter dokdonensis]